MSFQIQSWAGENIVPFLKTNTEKLVFMKLAQRADDAGFCRPGVDRTAADLNISSRSVQRAQRSLEKIGVLKIEARPNKPHLYFIQLNFLFDSAKTGGDSVSPEASTAVTPITARGDTVSPKSVSESIIESTTTTNRCGGRSNNLAKNSERRSKISLLESFESG